MGDKKYYELTDDECKKLIKLGDEAMKNTYPVSGKGYAAIHGKKDIVAITGPNCHICKQLIYESSLRSGIDVVVVFEEDNQIKQIPISKMMPYPWPENLQDEKAD